MNTHPYDALTPDVILDAVDSTGLRSNGSLLALNSYENRVYQVGLDDHLPVVVKFYRPQRWTRAAIEEEHRFCEELAEREVPVVAPMPLPDGNTLGEHNGFLFAVYERRGGHRPELQSPDELLQLGRFLGRIHALGAIHPFHHRPGIDIQSYGIESREWLLQSGLIPADILPAWSAISGQLLEVVAQAWRQSSSATLIRLHGDFHPGNILVRDERFHLVDFDDCRMGPAVQDLWMLLSGERHEMIGQLSEIVDGYDEFHSFDSRELILIEPLRALRLLHYSAWLGRRWDDPAFPLAFPWFNTQRYWEEQIDTLKEQFSRLQEPPLALQ
ncbi:MAG: serine/threonine protein kinase [Chromatiales bacterium]|nr:serine/threonine protein kinase [Chromatiales bacterium]